MKISKLIKQLEKIQQQQGNVTVMFSGPNMDQDVYSVGTVEFCVAEADEFDPDWNMPEGFKFVRLCND